MATQFAEGGGAEGIDQAGAPSTDLVVDEVRVHHFRSLVDVANPLDPVTTYLVGENNAGKSSLEFCLVVPPGER